MLDESHKLKSYNAKRSKLVEALANPYDKKLKKPVKKPLTYILSGTPVLNSIQDLFMQFLILDGGATFGGNFFAFRARYMRDKNAGMPRDKYFPAWEVRPGAFEEVNKLIYHHAISAKKEECLDLPDLIKTTVKVQMAPEQARMYKEMKKDFITVLNDVACTATLAITKSLRLLQLSSGFVKLVDGEEVPLADNPKMAALKELLEEITPSHKVLIWCVFKQNYSQVRQVCESLGLELVEITGEQSPTQKNEGVERFKTDPKVRVLCGHPQSGGIGLNLIEASYMIFYSRSFSLENDIQAEARCYRGGSEVHSKITRIDLITEGTIDELASVSLANKQEVSMKVMREWAREED